MNIQVFGQGILWMFYPLSSYRNLKYKGDEVTSIDSLIHYDALRALHNGFLFSTFGAIDTRINGVALSLFYGQGFQAKGLAANLFRNNYNLVKGVELGLINEAGEVKGLQLGLINKALRLKGIQIGLWNVNEKRKLPIINWN